MTRKRSSCDARLCRAGRPASGRRLSANVARLLVWAWLAAAACTLPGLCLADEDEDATPVAGAAVQPDRPAALALTGMFGVAGGAVRLERRVVASRVKEPAAPRSADGRPLDWQRAMVWLPRGRHELGWGVAVPAAAVGAAGAAPAATAAAVGGATAPVASDAGLLLLGAGRIFGSGVSVRMGVSVPLSALGPAWVNAAPTELAAGDAAGASRGARPRVGLSLATRRPLDGVRRGLQMSMELSSSTTLSLKPRRSRVLVELHSTW